MFFRVFNVLLKKSNDSNIMKYKLTWLVLITSIISVSAADVDTLMVRSNAMKKSIANVVITPDLHKTQEQAFPVLYLLHGEFGNHQDWISKVPAIKEYADLYNMIIVCPNGGFNSWYFDSPVDGSMRYETYISKELVKTIDETYNTIEDKSGRAITGLSMGGHGAFYLSFRNQDVWGAAGSMSGGVDIRPFPNNWSMAERLGTYAVNKENWENHTVINMLHLLDGKNLKLIFDCGVDDFFYDVNVSLHNKMLERNIPHEYIERPGKHNWDYWANAVKYQLLFFNDFFSQEVNR